MPGSALKTTGTIAIVVGAVVLALGFVALFFGWSFLDHAFKLRQGDSSGLAEMGAAFVALGLGLVGVGLIVVIVGIVLHAMGRRRERQAQQDGSPA